MSNPASPPASPLQLPATWDAVAAGYAQELLHQTGFAEEALRIVAPGSHARVLDVGTGPGGLAFLAAPRVAQVDAIDFSPGMIEQVRARAVQEHVGNVIPQVMDGQALGFADQTFDAAFALFVFMFFPDRARALAEIRRVLRPGGRVAIATWAVIERRPLMKIGFDALAEALPELPPMPKGDLQQPEECVRELAAAGFRDVQSQPFSSVLRAQSPAHYLSVMERTGAPFALLKKRLGEPAWAAVEQRMLAAVARQIPADGADLAAEALITSGTR